VTGILPARNLASEIPKGFLWNIFMDPV